LPIVRFFIYFPENFIEAKKPGSRVLIPTVIHIKKQPCFPFNFPSLKRNQGNKAGNEMGFDIVSSVTEKGTRGYRNHNHQENNI